MNTFLPSADAASPCVLAPPVPYARLIADGSPPVEWIWDGYLARRNVTLLTSQWKTGKTTLLAVLLSKLASGGKLAELEVRSGRACVVTEEIAAHWHRRGTKFDFGPHLTFFCRPFRRKPDHTQWLSLIDALDRQRAEHGLDLVVIDTLPSFLPPGVENQDDAVVEALAPLEKLTAAGTAVLLLHHPRKGELRAGQAARGSGALSGLADILVEMQMVHGAPFNDRRRRLTAWSRYDETPRRLLIDLAEDGCDYLVREEASLPIDEELELGIEVVQEVLARVGTQLTREKIVKHWPERRVPGTATVWRWLDRAIERGLVVRYGRGRAGDPFRYALAGMNVSWEPDREDLLNEIHESMPS